MVAHALKAGETSTHVILDRTATRNDTKYQERYSVESGTFARWFTL